MQTWHVMDVLVRDTRYAVRMLRRAPGFAATAIATLALVIGANTAVFSLANGLLLAPLPFPHADELHLLQTTFRSPRGESSGTAVDGHTWRALEGTPWAPRAAVFTNWTSGVNLALDGQAMFVDQQRVGAGFFRTLGVTPRIGREFHPDEDIPGGPPVAVLSHDLWQRVFAADPEVLGRTVWLRGEPWHVVGVMPEGFRGTTDADIWTPLRPSTTGEGGGTNYAVVLRVPADMTPDEAVAQLRTMLDPSLRERGVRDDVTATVSVQSLKESMSQGSRDVILLLGAAAVLVLLIACANLAALLLARGGARSREVATRMALGSGRLAVVRQLMVESLVLALIGGAVGLLVGWLGLSGLQALAGDRFPDWQRVAIDGRVLAASAALSVVTSLMFGLVPAWQAGRLNVQSALIEGGARSIAGGARHWTRRGLVVVEVALGVVLLVSAGLLVRTFVNLQALDPGFRAEGLTTTSVSLLDARYPGPEQVNQLFDRTLEHLRATPGVQSATVSLGLPFERLLNMVFQVPGEDSGQVTSVMYAAAGFFQTLGIETRQGRVFDAQDRADGLPVVVVNDAFVRHYSPDRAVIGRVFQMAGVDREVVGVVGDVQQRPGFVIPGMMPGPLASAPIMYVPVKQVNAGLVSTHVWFQTAFTVRAATPAVGEQALTTALASSDPLLPIGAVRQMSQVQAGAVAMEAMLMILIGTLATVAMLLTALGLHGVIAHSVSERTREFGIRIALGASPGTSVREVTVNGVILASLGILIGMVLAIPASSLVEASLYGVAERDVATYVGAAVFLLLVATVASLVPALRLLRLDPAETLRR